jgi:hypothetical protein
MQKEWSNTSSWKSHNSSLSFNKNIKIRRLFTNLHWEQILRNVSLLEVSNLLRVLDNDGNNNNNESDG